VTEHVRHERQPPRPFQRLIARAARLLARGIYRSVEVDNTERGWSHHPSIIVANHPTGFSDPALLFGLLERNPRFLAKATLWDTLGVGWFLDGVGAIPVYRAQDGSTTRNAEMFAAAYVALGEGEAIAVFPEGRAYEPPHLAPMSKPQSGAAPTCASAMCSTWIQTFTRCWVTFPPHRRITLRYNA
jgi:1-acyl-sn-glycerol-3-phosphate acyltransferase